MADSPHQPESLSDKITRLKSDREALRATRTQILTLGQGAAGAGQSTTYPSLARIESQIAHLDAVIDSFVAQLNGDCTIPAPGVNLIAHCSEY